MKSLSYIFTAILIMSASVLFGQQMKQKIDMRIDSIGNATLHISMKMNAAQWQTWTQTYGNNPAALKREMKKEMPAFFLDDFNLEKNDMERTFDLSLKAYGVCKVDKRGNWILETDDKDVDLTELTSHKYMYVNSPEEFGGQLQQTTIVSFPEEAQGIKVDEDAFGKTIFEFDMQPPSAGGGNLGRWAGILLLVGGLVWGGLVFFVQK